MSLAVQTGVIYYQYAAGQRPHKTPMRRPKAITLLVCFMQSDSHAFTLDDMFDEPAFFNEQYVRAVSAVSLYVRVCIGFTADVSPGFMLHHLASCAACGTDCASPYHFVTYCISLPSDILPAHPNRPILHQYAAVL